MTATETTTAYRITAIAPDVLAELRVRDDAGQLPRVWTHDEGGAPLRCCLRPVAAGERVALVSYAPLRRWAAETGADPGPYDETGPVFIHPEPCGGPAEPEPGAPVYPAALAGRPRVLRYYSAGGHILGGRLFGVGEPADAAAGQAALTELFADPAVALVHARAVGHGCFTCEARRH
jgi:hypothetical protein